MLAGHIADTNGVKPNRTEVLGPPPELDCCALSFWNGRAGHGRHQIAFGYNKNIDKLVELHSFLHQSCAKLI